MSADPLEFETEEQPPAAFDLALWKRLMAFAKPHRKAAAWLVVFALSTAACDTAYALVTRAVIDDVAPLLGEPGVDAWEILAPYGWIYAGLSLGLGLSVLGFLHAGARLRSHIGHDIRESAFANLQRLELAYFDHRPVGWLMARLTSDTERLTNLLAWGLLDFAWGFATIGAVTVILSVLSWPLALVSLSVLPLLAWVSIVFQRRLIRSARAVRGLNSRVTAAYSEGLQGRGVTKLLSREDAANGEFADLSAQLYSRAVQNAVTSAVYLPIVLVLSGLAVALVIVLGGSAAAGAVTFAGTITLGTLVAFLTYARQMFDPVQELAAWFCELQMAQAAAERVLSLIDTPAAITNSERVERELARERLDGELAPDGLPDAVGEVRFENVEFAYPDGTRVFHGLDLALGEGETVALVGSTGSGKSTLASLACRFVDPQGGRVTWNGRDLRDRALEWIGDQLGIVLQAPFLFAGSLRDNVRYGRLEASDAEVERIGRAVGLDRVVAELPDGWDTEVGEGGSKLSLGEKQLVSLARALLKDPRLLVLDEATSSLDTETELRIQSAVDKLLEGRTSLVIAHRLSTIRRADRIVVLEQGEVLEQGTHAELLAAGGRYAELAQASAH